MGPAADERGDGAAASPGGPSTVLAIVLALMSALGYGSSDYAAGLASREASVLKVTVLSEGRQHAVAAADRAVGQLAAADGGRAVVGCGRRRLSEVVGTVALYLGFRHAAFSVASSLSAVGSAAFSVLAGLLLGERPGTLALVGIGLALPAIVGVSAEDGRARRTTAGQPRRVTASQRRRQLRRAGGARPAGTRSASSSACWRAPGSPDCSSR